MGRRVGFGRSREILRTAPAPAHALAQRALNAPGQPGDPERAHLSLYRSLSQVLDRRFISPISPRSDSMILSASLRTRGSVRGARVVVRIPRVRIRRPRRAVGRSPGRHGASRLGSCALPGCAVWRSRRRRLRHPEPGPKSRRHPLRAAKIWLPCRRRSTSTPSPGTRRSASASNTSLTPRGGSRTRRYGSKKGSSSSRVERLPRSSRNGPATWRAKLRTWLPSSTGWRWPSHPCGI